jgi:hypothetical protein
MSKRIYRPRDGSLSVCAFPKPSLSPFRIPSQPLLVLTMMFFAYTTALVTILAALTDAAVVPRASTKCHTINSGYLSAYIGRTWSLSPLGCININFICPVNNGGDKAFDLNSKEQLTFGSGKAVEVAFQVSRVPCNKDYESGSKSLSSGMPRLVFCFV